MSSAKSQVAIATQNIPNLTSTSSASASASASSTSTSANTVTGPSTSQPQRDYGNTEESLTRQNTFGNNRRGNSKGKHLTRSHAMRESTSPPRTPTPRADNAPVSPTGQISGYNQQQNQQQHQNQNQQQQHHQLQLQYHTQPQQQQHHSHHQQQHQQHQQQQINTPDGNESYNNNNNNNIIHTNSSSNNNKLQAQTGNPIGSSPINETPAVILTSQQQQQQQNVPLTNEAEFPKLSPPKSTKNGVTGNNATVTSGGIINNNNNGSSCSSPSTSNSTTNNNSHTGAIQRTNGSNNNIIDPQNKTEQSNADVPSRKVTNEFKYGGNNNNNNNNNAGGSDNQRNTLGGRNQQDSSICNQIQAAPLSPTSGATTSSAAASASATTAHSGNYNSGMNYTAAPSLSDDHQQQQPSHHSHSQQQHQQNLLLDEDTHHYQQHHQLPQQSHHHLPHFYERERERGGGGSSVSGSGSGSGSSSSGGNKKHRANSSSKGPKPRLKNVGSASASGEVFNNLENSGEQYTDNGGTDLLTFFRETLNNKNIKDRQLLLKIEKDLIDLVQDKSRTDLRFPSASSYNRMLIHRTAAYFGLDHNVDADTQQCVIVAVTKNTRIPDIRFKALMRDYRDDARKSILKRDTHSFDEARQSSYLCPDRGGMLDRKAKSFEEREEDYERARSRIFNRSHHDNSNFGADGMDENYINWSNSVEQQQQPPPQHHQQQQHHHNAQQSSNRGRSGGKMMKMQGGANEPRERASGSASGSASGAASGSASGSASGPASGAAAGPASGPASGSASGPASGPASGSASGAASGSASGSASGPASGSASGPASGSASGAVPKTHSYSNYNSGPSQNGASGSSTSANNAAGPSAPRGESNNANKNGGAGSSRNFNKQQDPSGSSAAPWRLSPSRNGCKTCTKSESVLLDPLIPSPAADNCSSVQTPPPAVHIPASYMACFQPAGYVAVPFSAVHPIEMPDEHMAAECIIGPSAQVPTLGLVWAVTDISNVPKGSVLINPQTLRPVVNQDGSLYHFDPSNLPSNQQGTSSAATHHHDNQNVDIDNDIAGASNYSNQPPQQQQQQQQQQQAADHNKIGGVGLQQQQQLQHSEEEPATSMQTESPDLVSATDENFAQTTSLNTNDGEESQDCSSYKVNDHLASDTACPEEATAQIATDEPESKASDDCLTVTTTTTTTSTKNYERIEVQKYKNQPTSPKIPNEKTEPAAGAGSAAASTSASAHEKSPSIEASVQPTRTSSRNQAPVSQASTSAAVSQHQPQHHHQQHHQQRQHQHQHQHQQHQQHQQHHAQLTDALSHSSRSTPYSNIDSYARRLTEEPKPQSWTYTQSFQAPDGSTMFHTTTAPNNSPYCTTTYQQGPDGSVYAIPQSMVYAYPPPVDGELQGYFMPVYDPTQPRTDPTSLMSAGAQAVYPSAPASASTMVPMATAYPATQFATTNATPIFPGQVIYSSEQQQIPMTTYPTIGYSYPYNGYWGQTMTYYVPTQQATLTNAVAGAPLLQAPPQPPPQAGPSAAALTAASHIAGGMNLGNGLIAAPAPAHSANSVTVTAMGGSTNPGAVAAIPGTSSGSSYHVHSGTTYYGTGRIKRPTPPHYSVQQTGAPQLMAAMPAGGNTGTTYHQIGHATLPTLTLAAAPGSGAAATANDLNNAAQAQGATMYAVPQHAAVFSTNMFPYAAAAAPAPAGSAASAAATSLMSNTMLSAGGTSAAAAAQPANTVLTPFYAHRPQLHSHVAATAPASGAIHAPGPAAIPIVDPATLTPAASGLNSGSQHGSGRNAAASHSAPSTPHSQSIQLTQRNPPLFSTPPIVNSTSGNNGSYSNSSTPHYYTTGAGVEHPTSSNAANSPQNVYVPTSSYEKRSGKKSLSHYNSGGGNSNRQGANNASYNNNNASKASMYSSSNDNRGSPNSNSNSNSNNNPSSSGGNNNNSRGHGKGKGGNNNNNSSSHNNSNNSNTNSNSSSNNTGNSSSGGGGGAGSNNTGGGAEKTQSSQSSYAASSSGTGTSAGTGNAGSSSGNSNAATSSSYGIQYPSSAGGAEGPTVSGKPPVRLNAAAASFRHKPSGVEFRRNLSQRNSPGTTNSSSNDSSNNNSPNGISNYPTTSAAAAASSYGNNSMDHQQQHSQQQQQQNQPQSQSQQHQHQPVYITATAQRTTNIPGPQSAQGQIQNGGSTNAAVAAGSQASAALGGAAAAAAAGPDVAGTSAAANHHQPLLGSYNPGGAAAPAPAPGVFFKYGQTYLAHPSVPMPNNRRSPSTDVRPPMPQMTGIYPAVNMMIPAPPRHSHGRHPNPNYKGTRPR